VYESRDPRALNLGEPGVRSHSQRGPHDWRGDAHSERCRRLPRDDREDARPPREHPGKARPLDRPGSLAVRTALILVRRPQCHPVSARAHAGRASPDDRDWVIAFVLLTGTQTAFVLFFPLVITVLALGHGA
jgi:hypothetical protein